METLLKNAVLPAGESLTARMRRPAALFDGLGRGWKMIVRNVFRQGARNALLGLMICFASLVIVFFSQFLEGVSHNFTRNLIQLASGEVYVSSRVEREVERNLFDRDYHFFVLPEGFYQALEQQPAVDSVNPRLEFDAQIVTERDTVPYRIMAFDPAREAALQGNFTLLEGRLLEPGEYGILVPADLARRQGLRVGDRVRVLARAVNRRLNVIDYQVTGIFSTRNLSAWFDNYAYLDLGAARTLVDEPRALTRLNVHLRPAADGQAVTARLDELLAGWTVKGNPPLEATHWSRGAAFFVELTQAMQAGYLIIIVIVTVMIAASLAFTTMMTIVERTKEIATLAALGATPGQLRRLLVGENLVLAAGAALAGTLLAGLLFAVTSATGIAIGSEELRGFLGSAHFYPAFAPGGFIGGLLVPVLVALVASHLVARRAAKLPIAEAMADR